MAHPLPETTVHIGKNRINNAWFFSFIYHFQNADAVFAILLRVWGACEGWAGDESEKQGGSEGHRRLSNDGDGVEWK